MNRDHTSFANYHVTYREEAYLSMHVQLCAFVLNAPETSYEDYQKKAKSWGLSYMSKESYVGYGFGNEFVAP